RTFLRQPSAEGFLLLGLAFLVTLALVKACLVWPAHGTAKAFYTLPGLVAFCAFGAWGLDALARRAGKFRPVVIILFGVWALASIGSFWISRSSASTWLARARSLRTEGHYAEAVGALEQGLQTEPQNLDARSLLAETLHSLQQQPRAAAEASLVLSSSPENVSALLVMSRSLAEQNLTREAIDQARKAVASAPGEILAYRQLTSLLMQQEHYQEAEPVARAGLGVDAWDADLRFALGMALIARAAHNEAL